MSMTQSHCSTVPAHRFHHRRCYLSAVILAMVTHSVYAEDWLSSWTTATLSQERGFLAAASAGNKVFFAGGGFGGSVWTDSNVVDIYDPSSGTWSTASLSAARYALASAVADGRVFFGGGRSSATPQSDVVDIYDTRNGTWSTATLSEARWDLCATSASGKVFFAGGRASNSSNAVDVFDTASGQWSIAHLSQPRHMLAATSAGTKVFFAGGTLYNYGDQGVRDTVDIFDTATGTWSTARLSVPRAGLEAVSVGDKVFFAGGVLRPGEQSDVVDIYDTTSGTWTTAHLSVPRAALAATSVGTKVFFGGGDIPVAFGGGDHPNNIVDVYDTATNTWSTAALAQARSELSAVSVGNEAFFAGGLSGAGYTGYTNVVDIYRYVPQDYAEITSFRQFTLCDQTNVAGVMHLNLPGSLHLGANDLTVGSMSGDAPMNIGSATLTVGGDNTPSTTYSGPISGGGQMIKVGTGTLVLKGDNTCSGPLKFNGGLIQASSLSNLGSSPLIFNGGGLKWAPSATFDPSVRTVTFTGNATFDIAGNSVTLANAIGNHGPGELTKTGSGTLILRAAANYSGGTTVSAGRLVASSGATLSGNLSVAPKAQFENSGGNVHLSDLANSGTFLGNARISGTLANQPSGSIRIAAGQTVFVDGTTAAHTNAGLIEVISNPNVLGGQAEFTCLGPLTNAAGTGLITGKNAMLRFEGGLTNQGSIGLSYGTNDVFGKINNTGKISIGGNTSVTFYDDLVQNGTFTVSAVGSTRASAVIFGAVTGSGGFSGGGDVILLGDLRPGNSPSEVAFDANVFLSPSTTTVMELGGLSVGTQYDRINVGGSLACGGTLDIVLLDSFIPKSGDRFDLFDGYVTGTFDTVSLPPLAQGLNWDKSSLYTTGVITVVPEPDAIALLLTGAAAALTWALRAHSRNGSGGQACRRA